jgi:hypothetical protein
MQNAIWTKTAGYGTVETDGNAIYHDGAYVIHHNPAIELPRSKWLTAKDGRLFTHLIAATKFALTRGEATAYNAAYDAFLAERAKTVKPVYDIADESAEFGREMDREDSRW